MIQKKDFVPASGGSFCPIAAMIVEPEKFLICYMMFDSPNFNLMLWDLTSGKSIWNESTCGPPPTNSLSSDRTKLITVWGTMCRVHDPMTGVEQMRFEGHDGTVLATSLSPDGRYLASTGCDKRLRIWDCADGSESAEIRELASVVGWSHDGRYVICAGGELNSVRFWNYASGKLSAHVSVPTTVRSLSSHPRDPTLACGLSDGRFIMINYGQIATHEA